ncbi:hypothetical protein B0H15DRAFT_947488 [Mycena belliarum]|uniref:CxC2-like cysteine cluster KDZ transposase-associated domain-containing protein n=1 Tax=Mycena belliarum TaxID=1033014 RepID=A0AAD6U751_9AGAR|nr:hypothetical protein B0H15DRAFT_947488 [Mycena belliae]
MSKRPREVHFAPRTSPAPDTEEPTSDADAETGTSFIEDLGAAGRARIRIGRGKKHEALRPGARLRAAVDPATASGSTSQKTRITAAGSVKQKRTVVEVAAAADAPAILRPDVPRAREPVYDLLDNTEDGGMDGDFDWGRDLRQSDNPLRQWSQDHLQDYLAEFLRWEGRGDHGPLCAICSAQTGEYRCSHCLNGGELLCAECVVDAHRRLPFHQIQHWTGAMYERITLKDMGLRIQLGHWHSPDRRCPVPTPAFADDFVVIDIHGIHEVGLDYCGCGASGLPTVQLLRARLFPATTTNPRTAATFAVMRHFHLLSFESKCSLYEFYQSLSRQTDNMRYKETKPKKFSGHRETYRERQKKMRDRYDEFSRMVREWRHIQMLKRAGCALNPEGIASTAEGACALLCPACPHPGINLPADFRDAPEERQFLYALFLAIDANFRLKRKDVSTEEKDPGLGKGWAFFCEVTKYMTHVKKFWKETQERSHCVAHDAVDKPDRDARGTASSGIGAVDCARHNMKRPCAVGDLQLGERYINMDYILFRSVAGTELIRFFISYDIVCQWHINIWNRMLKYVNEELTLDGRGKFVTFLIPKFHLPAHIEACNLKFSFNLTRDVGQTDGEAPERGWADANPLAGSTKEMGPGSRRDTLDDHFNDWNHKKIIALGYVMRKKIENAVPEMVETKAALGDMEESLTQEAVVEWNKMAAAWEQDGDKPNPFETLRKDDHLAKVRRDLAAEAAEREEAGGGEEADVRGDMHITEFLGMGLQLEDQQRTIAFDVAATGLHPTENQRRAMTERCSKLRRKIFAWIEVQDKFYPQLARLRELEDDARVRAASAQPVPGIKVSDISLWLPSSVAATPGPDARTIPIREDVYNHEYRLRVAQANEALHELRRLLLVCTHCYKLKDKQKRGVRANMRSGSKIDALNNHIKRAAAQYRAGRCALVSLGKVLGRSEWERSLLDLKEDDIRGLPRATFGDPERQKGKKKKQRSRSKRARRMAKPAREISWIWISRGQGYEPGDSQAMDEAVRIEWAKARARACRWREEVDLLEEEMRRILAFLSWRAGWWRSQVGRKGLLEGPQLQGETAYALRQAALQVELRARFLREWIDIPELIRRGRAGELVVERDVDPGEREREEGEGEIDGSETGSSSGEEEEAIPSLPVRELRPSYVDEVLVM